MIPIYYQRLAQQIHQERIQAAQRPRPEWADISNGRRYTRPGRPSLRAWLLARLPVPLGPRVGSRTSGGANASRSSAAPGLSSNV